jgi:hypothetical protein
LSYVAQKRPRHLQPMLIPPYKSYRDQGKGESKFRERFPNNQYLALRVYQQMKLEVGVRKKGEWKGEGRHVDISAHLGWQGVRRQCLHQRDVSIEGKGMRIIFERCIKKYIR